MERGRTITKGLALGSVAAVAVAGVYLSQALPGHSASTGSSSNGTAGAATPVAPTANSGNSGTAPTANSGNSGTAPSAPASAPAPAYNQAPVVSSGSS